MYGYVYITRNVLDGRWYVGKHKSNILTDAYLGSGLVLRRAIKKHGRECFVKEVIAVAENASELDELECRVIAEMGAFTDPAAYNLTRGGDGGNTRAHLSDEELAQWPSMRRRDGWRYLTSSRMHVMSA